MGADTSTPGTTLEKRTASEPTVADCFARACETHAAKIAVHDLHRAWTYDEFGRWVARLRADVVSVTAPGDPVAILLDNDARLVAAALGVLTAGRGVVPLDPSHPFERLQLIARHAGVRAVLTGQPYLDDARRLIDDAVPLIDVEEPGDVPAASMPIDPDALAWVLYTSGSTGKPKGVYQNHRGFLREVLLSIDTIGILSSDRQALFYPLAVIAGLRAALGALLAGAELHVLPPRELGIEGLASEVRARKITLFRSSATLFRAVAACLRPGERFEHLRRLAVGGDYVHWADYDLFRSACADDADMECHLGSTECTGVALQWFIDPTERREAALVPVGYPTPDFAVALHDESGTPVTDGETGEFVVTGPMLAQGYWRDPELTAARFSPAPNGARTLHTGDLGRRRASGLFEFVGRKDHQIKLHGHRVELGEIEAVLRDCSGVRDAAIIVRRNERGIPRGLAAYVQLRDGVKGLLPRHLIGFLEEKLPHHMVPGDVYICDELPWLNFKIDRLRLEEMDRMRAVQTTAADGMAAEVARVFEAVLNVGGATPDDSLASLGGDSLQAVDIVLRMEKTFGIKVPQEMFRSTCSIRELGAWLEQRVPSASAPPVQSRTM